MARTARKLSESGIYHVILRGINRQQIFYDEEDYEYFISLLERFQAVSHYELYAYCLMGNHIHLLLKTGDEPLDRIFRRIGASFVYWYNLKYQRVGHLFQNRFKSEPVETDQYFLTAMRYILRNPVKAGLCVKPEDYPYSNIRDLTGDGQRTVSCLIEKEELLSFIDQDNDDQCLEISEAVRFGITDSAAKEYIRDEFGDNAFSIRSMDNRDSFYLSIQRLAGKGISVRQLSRLSGIPKSVIENALK